MRKPRPQLLFLILVAFVPAIVIGCGGGDSPSPPFATQDPTARRATEEAKPTVDIVGHQAEGPIRDTERALERLNVLVGRFDERIAKARSLSGGTPEDVSDDWFTECCAREGEDIFELLLDAEAERVGLITAYQEAADEPRLQIVRQLETPLANVTARVTELEALPTSDGAASILADMLLELTAFSEAFASLS